MDFLSGQRFHPDYTRVGGVMRDIPDEEIFKKMIHNFLDERLPKAMKDMETLLNRNRIFVDRVQGIGIVTEQEATAWSLTGPLARASGVRRDLRVDSPYLCFADDWDGQGAEAVEFDIPMATDGDCLCRYLVRLEEMRQSSRIIKQLIDDIPSGPINSSPDGKMHIPEKGDVYGSIEATIQHFELIMTNRGWNAPVGEIYSAIESPNGEYGLFIVADGGKNPWRASVRPPSFINFQAFAKMLEGHQLADFVAVLGSVNVIAAELDR